MNYGTVGLKDLSSYGSYSSYGAIGNLQVGSGNGLNVQNVQHTLAKSVPISEHVEVTKPLVVPIVKNIGKIGYCISDTGENFIAKVTAY